MESRRGGEICRDATEAVWNLFPRFHGGFYDAQHSLRAPGPPVTRMLPYFRNVQKTGKPLLIRGFLTPEETRLLLDSLEPRGLFLNIMVRGMEEVEVVRPLVGM